MGKFGKSKAKDVLLKGRLKARKLKDASRVARLKKNGKKLQVKLMKSSASDALKLAKDRKLQRQMEKAAVNAKAKAYMLKTDCDDLRAERKTVLKHSRYLATGLKIKMKDLKLMTKKWKGEYKFTAKWKKKLKKMLGKM